jgi:hypothetical protein
MTTRDEILRKRDGLLLPTIAALREELRTADVRLLAIRAGGDRQGNTIRFALLGEQYAISWPDVVVRSVQRDDDVRPDIQVLLLTYLRNADGTPPTGSWISFRELPNGGFYHLAFQGYAADRLAQRFGDDLDGFRHAAELVGGRREPLGDASYGFQALPSIWLAAVLWQADDEFPASARILFDESASRYLATDLLATLGRWLVGRLLRAAPQ